jgi:hypothetical protein
MNDPLAFAVLFPLAIGILGWLVFLVDWLGRRRARQKSERRT